MVEGCLLERNGIKAELVAREERVGFKKADADSLKGIEYLSVPKDVTELAGICFFPDLKAISYEGESDILGFGELVSFLTEKSFISTEFLKRVATNQIAFRQITPKFTAFLMPRVKPVQAIGGWRELSEAILYALCPLDGGGFYRQDDSRQNAILCNAYSQLMRLQWGFCMGFGASGESYPEETAAFYDTSVRLSPEQQVIYALALDGGFSYREFYASTGERFCGIMGSREEYIDSLKRNLVIARGEQLCRQLWRLVDCRLITSANIQAAVELMLKEKQTDAAAALLEYGERSGAIGKRNGFELIDNEFEL